MSVQRNRNDCVLKIVKCSLKRSVSGEALFRINTIQEFPSPNWKRRAIFHLIKKLRVTGKVVGRRSRGRLSSARTPASILAVEEPMQPRKCLSAGQVSRRAQISRSPIQLIAKRDLSLKIA